jgi:hypothetical protein
MRGWPRVNRRSLIRFSVRAAKAPIKPSDEPAAVA